MTSFLKKVTLLIITLPSSMMVSLLTASMLQIYAEFPQYSQSVVTMILTIPNLTVMLGLMLAPILLKKYPIKYLILAGLGIFTICNVLPAYCNSFYLILLLRAFSGVGCGLILPLQATFLATYPEKERATLMGLSATVSCLVAALTVALSGIVASVNWRYVFFLYLLNIIGLISAALFLPQTLDQSQDSTVKDKNQPSVKLGDYRDILFVYYFLLTGGYLFFSILGSQIAPYLNNVHLGGSAESGFIMSLSLVGSTLSGLILRPYTNILKGASLTGLFVIATIGFTLLWLAPSLPIVALAAILIGFVSALGSCVINYELSQALPLELFTAAAAGVNFFIFVLQFLTPMLFLFVLSMIPSGSYRIVFMIYALIQITFAIIAYLLTKILLKQR